MSSLAVRPARLSDSGRIGEIHVAAWREAYADLMPPARLAALDVAERAAMWR
ncbi:MAG: family N-acetyltransferase, partial [Sphingomonas bacterium]|nr:family N-acetyltransferase [Sphingomonas bacterium]